MDLFVFENLLQAEESARNVSPTKTAACFKIKARLKIAQTEAGLIITFISCL